MADLSNLAAQLALIGGLVLPLGAFAEDANPPDVRSLVEELGFGNRDYKSLVKGKVISRSLDRISPKEIVVALVMRSDVPLARIQKQWGLGTGSTEVEVPYHFTVDSRTGKSLSQQVLEQVLILALLPTYDR